MTRRNSFRVFSRIPPGWDMDLHVHTSWSSDNLNGPSFEEYLPLADRYHIHIGFADHFEVDLEAIPEQWRKQTKLRLDTIDQYLEEIDRVKEANQNVSSGLEIDYYPPSAPALAEFVDRYRHEFDLLLGSVHLLPGYRVVTYRPHFDALLAEYGTIQALAEIYFSTLEDMLNAGLFDVIAHPDVIFRFLSAETRDKNPELVFHSRLAEISEICRYSRTSMEVNLSGLHYPWGQTFPSEASLPRLILNDIPLVVGSDSHSLADFEASVLPLRRCNRMIRNDWKFTSRVPFSN